MVEIHVPGWRWEAEFFADAHVQVEGFRSTGEVHTGDAAEETLARLRREDDEVEAAMGHRPPD